MSILIPIVINPLISNNRWKYFLSLNNINESFFVLAKINFMSIFYGLSLPSSQGHDAIRMALIEKRNPQKRGVVGSSVILERLLGLLSLSIIALASIFIGNSFPEHKRLRILVVVMSFFIIGAILVGASKLAYRLFYDYIYSRNINNALIRKMVLYIEKVHATIQKDLTLQVFFKSFVLILLLQITSIVNVFLIFSALGVKTSFTVHFFIMPIVYIVSMLPVTISGIGVREGVFAYMYSLVGVDPTVGVLASLLNYLILIITPAIVGMILVVSSHIRKDSEFLF